MNNVYLVHRTTRAILVWRSFRSLSNLR